MIFGVELRFLVVFGVSGVVRMGLCVMWIA